MTYIFPAELSSLPNLKCDLAASGIREVISVEPSSRVEYSFELNKFEAILFEVFAAAKIDVTFSAFEEGRPLHPLAASAATVLHQVSFRAPQDMVLIVTIWNRREQRVECQIHAVAPLSAVGRASSPCEREDGLPLVRLQKPLSEAE